jgi:hypothetical protein
MVDIRIPIIYKVSAAALPENRVVQILKIPKS